MNILLVFAISLAVMIIAIMRFEVNCGVALFGSAILAGLMSGMPIEELTNNLTSGFGSTMASIGLVILFGGCMGAVLSESGATEEMAKGILRKFGKKHDFLALNIAGMLISIPIYFAVGFIMLYPLGNEIQRITKKRMSSYCTAMYVGLIVTHCLVAPTPGPVAVAGATGANLGWFMLYSLFVAIPASLIGGVLLANIQNNRIHTTEAVEIYAETQELVNNEELLRPDPNKPSASLALLLLLLPVAMLIFGSVFTLVLPVGTSAYNFFVFIGDPQIALFISMLVNAFVLRKYLKTNVKMPVMTFLDKAANDYGSILLLLGSAGSFATVIKEAGMGDALLNIMDTWNLSILLMGFLTAFFIRIGVGSAAAAMATSISIVWPTANAMGYSPIIIGLAVCAGALAPLIPNDTTFWFPEKYCGVSTKETFSTVVFGNFLAGIIAFAVVALLNVFSSSLPGMF